MTKRTNEEVECKSGYYFDLSADEDTRVSFKMIGRHHNLYQSIDDMLNDINQAAIELERKCDREVRVDWNDGEESDVDVEHYYDYKRAVLKECESAVSTEHVCEIIEDRFREHFFQYITVRFIQFLKNKRAINN